MRWSSSRDASDRIGGGLTRMILKVADDLHLMQQHSLSGHQTSAAASELMDTIEHVHDFGFTNVPMPQIEGAVAAAEAFAISLGGNRGHNIIVKCGDRRYRLFGLENGEVALHDAIGNQFHLSKNGPVMSAPSGQTIIGQVMAAAGMPKPPQTGAPAGAASGSSSGAQQMGQGKQAGLASLVSFAVSATSFLAQFGPSGKPTTKVKVDKDHAVIRHVESGNTIWADKHGVHSTAPITVAPYPYKDP